MVLVLIIKQLPLSSWLTPSVLLCSVLQLFCLSSLNKVIWRKLLAELVKIESYKCSIFQVARDFWSFFIPTPYSAYPRTQIIQPAWAACLSVWLFSVDCFFPSKDLVFLLRVCSLLLSRGLLLGICYASPLERNFILELKIAMEENSEGKFSWH